jgi:hypothetical protein
MRFRRVLATLAAAVLGTSLGACGSYEEKEPEAGASSTGTAATRPEELSTPEECTNAWNGPDNLGHREAAAQLGRGARAVVAATGFLHGGEDEVEPTALQGCLFVVYAGSPDELAGSEVVAFVDGVWRDLAGEETAAIEPSLAGSAIADATVAPDGSLVTGPAGARLSKAAFALSAFRIVETYEPRASELFTMLVLGDQFALPQTECGRRALEFHRQLVTIVDEIEKLRPPREVGALHAEFLAAARESVDAVGAAAAAATRGELACGRPMNLRIHGLPSTERAERVLDELAERGYPLWGQ